MLYDIYALIDDAPIILKRPLLPYSINSFRIPTFVKYDKKISNWPDNPYYPAKNIYIHGILIAGAKFDWDIANNLIPADNHYSIQVEHENGKLTTVPVDNEIPKDAIATYICIGIDPESLDPYTRIEIVAITKQPFVSMYGTRDTDGESVSPMLLKIPDIQQKADALKYAKWAFQKISIEMIKENQTIFLYGGEIILTMRGMENEVIQNYKLGRFIINNISYDDTTVKIDGIDFRYILNKQWPVIKFLTDRTKLNEQAIKYKDISYFPENIFPNGLPFLEDEYIDKVTPEVIGIGNGIPGICLNGKQIYNETKLPQLEKITEYIYQFPPLPDNWTTNDITNWIQTKLHKIEIYISGNISGSNTSTGWTEIYPGLGSPNGVIRNENNILQLNGYFVTNPYPVTIDMKYGLVYVNYRQALENGEYGNTPQKIRMFAEWPNIEIKDAINYLFKRAHAMKNNIEELQLDDMSETSGLKPIGLYLDKSDTVFNWIEQLQSSNILSGQLALINDKIIFRLENPNREKKLDISITDVLNHETLSVGLATNLLFSGYDITYKKSYSDNDTNDGHLIGENERYPTAEIYTGNDLTVNFIRDNNLEKRKEQHYDTSSVQIRANILNDLIKTFRHKIDGVEVPINFDYMELQFYDVVGYIPKQLTNTGINYEWLLYNKKINIQKRTVSFDLIERVKTNLWNKGNP